MPWPGPSYFCRERPPRHDPKGSAMHIKQSEIEIMEREVIVPIEEITPEEFAKLLTDGGLEATERKILLGQLLAMLTERQHQVMCLILQGYTEAEVGKELHISQPAVCQLYARAVKRLRSKLNRKL